jgi:polyphosphate kinase
VEAESGSAPRWRRSTPETGAESESNLAPRPGRSASEADAAAEAALAPGGAAIDRAPNLTRHAYYINRELSWTQFNKHVLHEAIDAGKPLLERAKFVSIFSSNLDEFYMIRVSGLRRQLEGGVLEAPADGMSPAEQLAAIRSLVTPMYERVASCWADDIRPKLAEAGIRVVDHDELRKKQRKALRKLFRDEIFPVLTPLAFDPGHPFPHISNLSINLAVVVRDPDSGEQFARLKVPPSFDRLVRVPDRDDDDDDFGLERSDTIEFVWLEQVVAANLDLLFPGLEVVASYPFRITRDADVEIEEDEASDLLAAMVEVVGQRHFGSAIRLEVDTSMPSKIRDILMTNLEIAPYQVFSSDKPLGLADLMQLLRIDRPDLKDPPFLPFVPPALTAGDDNIFAALRRRGVLLHHPYDSFNPVVDFIKAAACDPHVLAIKQTLYRVGRNSPVVEALMEARENGKQVAAMVELKARFDEENNIAWARSLERAGVHVVYGLLGLKIHAKVALVVRREPDGIVRYVHLGTGNYNPVTARIYTDLGYFTTDPDIGADVSDLFNSLTGYARKADYNKLLVAPTNMKRGLLARIRREIEVHEREGGGYIAAKLNALVDKAIIRSLYRASIAGVRVELLVRGLCCLRPGLEGISDNITVKSIVGRFLEHSRIYYFRNGGDDEVLVGSADWMPRNLDGRIEVVFPVEDEGHKAAVRDEILFRQLADNVQARRLLPDGEYERIIPTPGEPVLNSQLEFLAEPGSWHRQE